MNIEKNISVVLDEDLLVDVCVSIFNVNPHAASIQEYDVEYSYNEAGLQESQIERLESLIESQLDEWVDDAIAEHTEEESDDADADYYEY